ncbi:MAG: hypothetical protein ACJAYE_000134 [Candidatus Azotimanducaceae bacterium]|jgi:hypothetical protein
MTAKFILHRAEKPSMKPIDLWITAIAVLLGLAILLLPTETVILFLSDDAYYYMKVAMNNVAGLGLTFDGINPTNGWHPLWMLLVHPIYLLQLDPTVSLRVMLLFQLGLYLLSFKVITVLCQRYYPTAGVLAALATLLFFAPITVLGLNGLESPLLVMVELVLIYVLFQFGETPDKTKLRLLLGLLFGLLFLSRLDSAFMILTLSAAILIFERRRQLDIVKIISNWWLPATISICVVAPYLIWNVVNHDHITPISGVLKNTFPYPHFRIGFLPRVPHFVIAIFCTAIWFAYRLYTTRHQNLLATRYGLLLAMSLGCLVHLAWSVIFMAWGTFQWHFVAQIPLIVIAVADLVSVAPQLKRLTAAFAVLLALGMNFGSLGLRLGHHQERLSAANWMNLAVKDGSRIGLRDAGVFGYFSDHQVVNLDGLINSYEFYDSINRGEIAEFLANSQVRYLADAYTPCDYKTHNINIVAHSSLDPRLVVGEIRIMSKSNEIASFKTEKLFESMRLGETCFVIWQGVGTTYPLQSAASRLAK